jgi:tetratricopeptide (TPR) repeat protein
MLAIAVAWFFLQADPYATGMKALDDGKFELAADSFRKAIEADPKDHTAHFNLALAFTMLNKDAEALAEYRKTLEMKPGLYEAQLNAGMLLMKMKQPAEALPLLEGAAAEKPGELRPNYFLGAAQLGTAAYDLAEASFRKALQIDPKSADAELGLGQALAREGKLADAAPHYRAAAMLDPELRPALLELAQLQEQAGESSEAIAIYQEFPDHPMAKERLGALLLARKQYSDAIPQLEAAYQKDASAANRSRLAAAYVLNGNSEKALPLLDQAVTAEPANYDLRMMYGRALRDRRQYPRAAAQFEEATKLKSDQPASWNELAGMLYLAGGLEPAYQAFERARTLGDGSAGNAFMRAIILDKLRQLKPALEAYRQFLALSQGKQPDQEFQARQRSRIIERELEKR